MAVMFEQLEVYRKAVDFADQFAATEGIRGRGPGIAT